MKSEELPKERTLANIRLCSCCSLPTWETGKKLEVSEWRNWTWLEIAAQTSAHAHIPCNDCTDEADDQGITVEQLRERK